MTRNVQIPPVIFGDSTPQYDTYNSVSLTAGQYIQQTIWMNGTQNDGIILCSFKTISSNPSNWGYISGKWEGFPAPTGDVVEINSTNPADDVSVNFFVLPGAIGNTSPPGILSSTAGLPVLTKVAGIASYGVAKLAGTSVTVNTDKVGGTVDNILLSIYADSTTFSNVGLTYPSNPIAATSFDILSTNPNADYSVAWMIVRLPGITGPGGNLFAPTIKLAPYNSLNAGDSNYGHNKLVSGRLRIQCSIITSESVIFCCYNKPSSNPAAWGFIMALPNVGASTIDFYSTADGIDDAEFYWWLV